MRRFGARSCKTAARSAARRLASVDIKFATPWFCSVLAKPVTSSQATVDVAPLRRSPRPRRMMWTRLINQSPVRVSSMPISSTTTASPDSTNVIERSSISPRTRTSPGRVSKRRIFNKPVITTAPLSIEVTRVIGTKTRRRNGTSTTSPRIRGG